MAAPTVFKAPMTSGTAIGRALILIPIKRISIEHTTTVSKLKLGSALVIDTEEDTNRLNVNSPDSIHIDSVNQSALNTNNHTSS